MTENIMQLLCRL